MPIHPNARSVVSKLTIPSPVNASVAQHDWKIDLSTNTNPYFAEFSTYPDVHQHNLKTLYLSHISAPELSSLTPENILFTVGSMEGIDILLRTFCEPNQDTICILHPTFGAYEHWGLIHNLKIKNIPLLGENFDTFSLDEIIQLNPKMVWICNPNNPTGTILNPKEIEALCQAIQGFVVVDEAYIEFTDHPSALASLNQYKNLIILRTFSKAWGLAGVRCGIIMADTPIIHSLRYVQLPFCLSSPTQDLVVRSLSHPERIFESWGKIKISRQRMTAELSTLTVVEKIFPSATNFLFIVLKERLKVMELLKEQNIKVLDYSASIPSSIRVSIGTEEQNQKFLEVIREASNG